MECERVCMPNKVHGTVYLSNFIISIRCIYFIKYFVTVPINIAKSIVSYATMI